MPARTFNPSQEVDLIEHALKRQGFGKSSDDFNYESYGVYISANDLITAGNKFRVVPCDQRGHNAVTDSHSRYRIRSNPLALLDKAWTMQESGSFIPLADVDAMSIYDVTLQSRNWVRSDSKIIEKLIGNTASDKERRLAVLFAETTEFPESLVGDLLIGLACFIESNRFSDDAETITAVASAIRKFVMNAYCTDLYSVATWLKPTATKTIAKDLELELAKGVVSRFSHENIDAGIYQTLFDSLSSLASDYLAPRLLLQENFASIALNATVGCCLIAARAKAPEMCSPLIDRFLAIRLDWLSELLARRLRVASKYIEERDALYSQSVLTVEKSLTDRMTPDASKSSK